MTIFHTAIAISFLLSVAGLVTMAALGIGMLHLWKRWRGCPNG